MGHTLDLAAYRTRWCHDELVSDDIQAVVDDLIRQKATCELRFELDGRQVGRMEMRAGKVRHAEMSGVNSGSALRVIRRLPKKTRAIVRVLQEEELGPKTLTSGAWEIPKL